MPLLPTRRQRALFCEKARHPSKLSVVGVARATGARGPDGLRGHVGPQDLTGLKGPKVFKVPLGRTEQVALRVRHPVSSHLMDGLHGRFNMTKRSG